MKRAARFSGVLFGGGYILLLCGLSLPAVFLLLGLLAAQVFLGASVSAKHQQYQRLIFSVIPVYILLTSGLQ